MFEVSATSSNPMRVVRPLIVIILLLGTIGIVVKTQASIDGVGPNIEIVQLPQDRQQVEPTIAIDPRNPSILVAGAQDYRLISQGGHRWHGYYRSVDGGQTWSQSLLPGFPGDTSAQGLASPLQDFNATSDPVLAFDRNGNVYYTGIAFNITGSNIGFLTLFIAKYVNDGADYAGVTIVPAVSADKPWIAVDTTGGPYDGNVYVAFDANFGGLFTSVFTRSTDGAQTFSSPIKVPSNCGGLPGVTVDPAGNIFVSTMSCTATETIDVSKLVQGGSILAGTTIAATITSLPSPLPNNSFRTFTIPQIAADSNGLYLVWDNFNTTTGNADAMFSRSTNAAASWSAMKRVNDVATGHQFFPTIATSAGTISLAWYDSRLNTGSTITALDVFYTQSLDAGVTFAPNVRITSTSFDPNAVKRTDAPNINEPFLGDYIHMAASPTSAHIIWADNRNACNTVVPTFGCVDQDAFTARISITPAAPVHDVSVYGLKASRDFAYSGVPSNPVKVNVTAVNLGSTTETITVLLKADSSTVGSQTVTLLPGAGKLLSFDWNAHLLPRGTYSLSAEASQVAGESNLSNNIVTDGAVVVRFLGDLDENCIVNIIDIAVIAFAYDTTPTSQRWNPEADLNNDGRVSILDVATAAANFGHSC